MRARKLFLTSAVLLLIGLISLWSKWNGTAGINAGSPISIWTFNFCGSVNGWPALIGIVSIIAALLVFLAAMIRAALESPSLSRGAAKDGDLQSNDMARQSEHKVKDILKLLPAPLEPPKQTARRIGIHTSTAGGVENAAERAYRLGCNALQIFSSSPRQWAPYQLGPRQCAEMIRLRAKYELQPLAIHANYLVNLAGGNSEFHAKSIAAFRGEVERALALRAEFLVLHPGSFRGGSREAGLQRAALGIELAADGLDLEAANLRILIENTAGSEFSLGGNFEQVAELQYLLRSYVPCGACIDTCHTHVAGYDIVSLTGYKTTLDQLERTVGLKNVYVWHCNDAKAARGSKLDRHQHIGKGTIGLEPFRGLLNDRRLAHGAFIAETPIDEPLDDLGNVNALKGLVKQAAKGRTRQPSKP